MTRLLTSTHRHGDHVEFARVRVNSATVASGAWHTYTPPVSAFSGLPTICGMATKPPARHLGIST